MTFLYTLNEEVQRTGYDSYGRIVGRSEFVDGPNKYQVRYTDYYIFESLTNKSREAKDEKTVWFDECQLNSVVGLTTATN